MEPLKHSNRFFWLVLCVYVSTCWLIAVSGHFLNDPDTFWHIATGRDIWQNGRFPQVDTYSHTYFGHPWIAKEWLSQVILFLSFDLGGWNAVVVLTIVSLGLTSGLLFWFLSGRLHVLLALAITLAAIFLSSQTYLARPHILSFPIIVVWTELVWRASEKGRAPSLWLLPLMTVWANLHASFAVGFLIAGFAFVDYMNRVGMHDRGQIKKWMIFLVLTVLAAVVHPYGIKPLVTIWTVFGTNDWPKFLPEWKALDLADEPIHKFILLALVTFLLVSGAHLPRMKALFVSAMLYLFLSHIRFAYLFYILTPLVASADLASQFPRSGANLRTDSRTGGPGVQEQRPFALAVVLMLLLAAVLGKNLLYGETRRPADIAPWNALQFAQKHGLVGNVLNNNEFGGFLIFNGVRTYADGRSDQLFDNDFLHELLDSQHTEGGESLQRILEKYKITWTLLLNRDPRTKLMDVKPGWQRVYQDDVTTIHVLKAVLK